MSTTESNEARPDTLMEKLATWLVPFLLLGLAYAGFHILGEKENISKKKPDVSVAPLVDTISIKAHKSSLDLALEGKVVPHKELILSAQVSGKIKVKKDICKPGRFVKKDTILLKIDSEDYDIAYQQAEQDLVQARNNITENKLEIKNTDELIKLASEDLKLRMKSLNRIKSLSGRKVISEAEMDSEERNVLVAKNSLQTLKNQSALFKVRSIKLAQSEKISQTLLNKAKLNVSRTVIKAPVSGVIVITNIENDSLVQPGMELLRIEDTSAVEIHVQMQMKELYWIWQQFPEKKEKELSRDYEIPQSPATVSYQLAGMTFQWKGRLERYEGIGLDEKTRTVACRIIVENPRDVKILNQTGSSKNRKTGPPALLRGMYVDISVHVNSNTPLLSVPEYAVQPGNKVWLVQDGKLEIIPVQVAEWDKEQAILNGLNTKLKEGDKIITSPIPIFKPGMKVQINQTEPVQKSVSHTSESNAL